MEMTGSPKSMISVKFWRMRRKNMAWIWEGFFLGKQQKQILPRMQSRGMTANFRAIEETEHNRKFTISFSSEEPYERYWGKEILDHNPAAVDLTRLNSIGVLLFNHNRDKVIGKINRAWIENQRGMAEVEFDSDEKSEVIFQKVKGGTLKGVSVGYKIGVIEEVMPGKVSTDGRFNGPCDVAREWMPYEISIVSVPADATVGVGRNLREQKPKAPETLTCFEAQLQINKNRK